MVKQIILVQEFSQFHFKFIFKINVTIWFFNRLILNQNR